MADVDAAKSLAGLLNGIAQKAYHNHDEVTEDLLRTELYPDLSPEDFHALHGKMRGLLKVGRGPPSVLGGPPSVLGTDLLVF